MFGNRVVQLGIHRPHHRLVVAVSTQVEITLAMTPRINPAWEQAAAQTAALRGGLSLDVSPFLASSRLVPVRSSSPESAVLREAFMNEFAPGRPLLQVIADVCSSIFTGYRFDPTATMVTTPLSVVLARRAGVCQDFAHLAVGAFRAHGLAARYVSGYIETDPLPARRRRLAPTRHTRGARCGSRSTGGSTLTRPMASSALTDM